MNKSYAFTSFPSKPFTALLRILNKADNIFVNVLINLHVFTYAGIARNSMDSSEINISMIFSIYASAKNFYVFIMKVQFDVQLRLPLASTVTTGYILA